MKSKQLIYLIVAAVILGLAAYFAYHFIGLLGI